MLHTASASSGQVREARETRNLMLTSISAREGPRPGYRMAPGDCTAATATAQPDDAPPCHRIEKGAPGGDALLGRWRVDAGSRPALAGATAPAAGRIESSH